MREIVLDTETTGFDPASGDRIVEIGCLELHNHVPTGRSFHALVDPERDVPQSAVKVHGHTAEKLRGQPRFGEVCEGFLAFIGEDPLVIHNAEFDMKFVNAELAGTGRESLPMARAIDTLTMARQAYPGAPASLDALCKRFGIDNSARTFHGALLDAELLAEVYLELCGGRQPELLGGGGDSAAGNTMRTRRRARQRPEPLASRISEAEREAHQAFVEKELGENSVWSALVETVREGR